jgi:hypothetical protein
MGAIGLNPIRLDRIGLDPIRINAIKLGVPGAASDRPYIDPEVLASLKAVCICYGKSNDDPDRAVVKNLVDPDNPFVISNAAYEGMSGCNGYPIILSGTNKTYQDKASYVNVVGDDKNIIGITRISFNTAAIFSYIKRNGTLTDYNRNIESFKVKVTGLQPDKFIVKYSYINSADTTERTVISITSDGIYELPKSFASDGSLTSSDVWIGLNFTKQSADMPEIIEDVNVTIEVLPEYEGAFVTDGIDDLITSTKTVQEMLGGSNDITVVSMIYHINSRLSGGSGYTNYIDNNLPTGQQYFRNKVISQGFGKWGIYGYSSKNNAIPVPITNILGDKADYSSGQSGTYDGLFSSNAKFSPIGRSQITGSDTSSCAWYWTIIANKVLTTDQINQVIAYFNLDRTLNPDILCNTIKQGITNENHAEFGDKLIDFSGNGRDIQLNNIAWKGDSGIGKYGMDFLEWKSNSGMNFTSTKLTSTKPNLSGGWLTFRNVSGLISETKVKVSGAPREFVFIGNNNGTDDKFSVTINNGVYTIPEFTLSSASGFYINNNSGDWSNFVIEQIPSHAGALCLDGVNDFGKATGMPIYKDYTFIIDYERISYTSEGWGGAIVSKSPKANNGAFISMMANSAGLNKQLFSFGGVTAFIKDDLSRILFWQTKYKSENTELTVGEGVDGDTLWLGTSRDNDSRFFNGAIYSLMSFPYSMSEFLIERQLKKHKLGTLYPDMVEFRPIVKSNLPYSSITYSVNPGEYISVDSMVTITVTLPNTSDKLMEVSCNAISDISISGDNGVYEITGKVVKSPQKINIVISSYLTMLSNSTLISNETLIKNE